jgi:hypothetical protein
MVGRVNLCLIEFRFLNSPEQRWHRPRCSSQASEAAAPNSPSMPFTCGCIPPAWLATCSVHNAATAGTSFGSLWRCSKSSAIASFYIWLRKAAGLVAPTRCGHTVAGRGLDPFDANTTLGFDDDERDDSIAACMLRMPVT